MIRPLTVLVLLGSVFVVGARAQQWPEHDLRGEYLYGYAAAGDDPRHVAEVEANGIPVNVASLTVNTPSDDITAKVAHLNARGQRAAIVLDKLLFKNVSGAGACGAETWRPWLNYQDRLAFWRDINPAAVTPEGVAFVVINTEVNNRCIDAGALDAVTRHVRAQLPGVRVVAGYGRTDGARDIVGGIPNSLDGVLFYRYYTVDPNTDEKYRETFAHVVAMLNEAQRVIIVPDGFYGPGHAAREWPRWYLGHLALNHVKFAQTQPRVVGVMYLLWPDGVNEKTNVIEAMGSRSLPQSVRDRQREAGCALKIQSPLLATCN